eukprot:3579136-Prymnesium_polylepis.3
MPLFCGHVVGSRGGVTWGSRGGRIGVALGSHGVTPHEVKWGRTGPHVGALAVARHLRLAPLDRDGRVGAIIVVHEVVERERVGHILVSHQEGRLGARPLANLVARRHGELVERVGHEVAKVGVDGGAEDVGILGADVAESDVHDVGRRVGVDVELRDVGAAVERRDPRGVDQPRLRNVAQVRHPRRLRHVGQRVGVRQRLAVT